MITTTRPGREPGYSLDDTIAALADRHRRSVLKILHHSPDGRMSYETLVERVFEDLSEDARIVRPAESIEVLKLHLFHCHLPKLERSGLLQFHEDNHLVESKMSDIETDLLITIEQYR